MLICDIEMLSVTELGQIIKLFCDDEMYPAPQLMSEE